MATYILFGLDRGAVRIDTERSDAARAAAAKREEAHERLRRAECVRSDRHVHAEGAAPADA